MIKIYNKTINTIFQICSSLARFTLILSFVFSLGGWLPAFSVQAQLEDQTKTNNSNLNRVSTFKIPKNLDNQVQTTKRGLALQSSFQNKSKAYPVYKYHLAQSYQPNDVNFKDQWGLKDQVSGIFASQAWGQVGKQLGGVDKCTESTPLCGGSPEVKIAVVDTGINQNVFDLSKANIDFAGSAKIYVTKNNRCNTGDQELDDLDNFKYCMKKGVADEDPIGGGHGTRVSSVIVASDNNLGGIGIAYNTTILPIALHQFSATDSGALDSVGLFYGIYHAVEKGARIINLSLGTPVADEIVKKAVDYANQNGVIVVASAGNCSVWVAPDCDFNGNGKQDLPDEASNAPFYPAGFDNTIAVGASNYATSKDKITRSCYSNIASYVDVVAPVGDFVNRKKPENIANCIGEDSLENLDEPNGVVVQDQTGQILLAEGTSFASPQVSAALALAISFNPNLNFNSAMKLLESSSIDIGTAGKDRDFGFGLLNLPNLLTQAPNQEVIEFSPFPDVPLDSTFAPFIYNLKDDQIIGGFSDGTFKPDNNVNRGEMAKFIRNAFFPGRLETFCGGFEDVPTSNPFFNEITTLKCLGVVSGFGNNQYKPEQQVNRGETMKFAIQAGRIAKPTPEPYPVDPTKPDFPDVSKDNTFYNFIMAGASKGIISGFSDGTFKPTENVSRGAMAKIVDNARFKDQTNP